MDPSGKDIMLMGLQALGGQLVLEEMILGFGAIYHQVLELVSSVAFFISSSSFVGESVRK